MILLDDEKVESRIIEYAKKINRTPSAALALILDSMFVSQDRETAVEPEEPDLELERLPKGIYHVSKRRFKAQACVAGVATYLGLYPSVAAAVSARDAFLRVAALKKSQATADKAFDDLAEASAEATRKSRAARARGKTWYGCCCSYAPQACAITQFMDPHPVGQELER